MELRSHLLIAARQLLADAFASTAPGELGSFSRRGVQRREEMGRRAPSPPSIKMVRNIAAKRRSPVPLATS
eukprot:scaffold69937_cov31-Tisochrysis_lutea.AAC.1